MRISTSDPGHDSAEGQPRQRQSGAGRRTTYRVWAEAVRLLRLECALVDDLANFPASCQ